MAAKRKSGPSTKEKNRRKAQSEQGGKKPKPIKDAIVLHVVRDVNGEEGNDGIDVELRGNVRKSELGFFIGLLVQPAQPSQPQ